MENSTWRENRNLTQEMNRWKLHQTQSGQAVIVFLSLQGVLIICANSLVFLLFATTKHLRTKTNYCLVSLAASDFLAGLVSLPLVLLCSIVFSNPICTSMDLCHRFQSFSTILHLLVATSERYFKIKRPFKYNILVTKRRVVALLMAVDQYTYMDPKWQRTTHPKIRLWLLGIQFTIVSASAFYHHRLYRWPYFLLHSQGKEI